LKKNFELERMAVHLIPSDVPYTIQERITHAKAFWTDEYTRGLDPCHHNRKTLDKAAGDTLDDMVMTIDRTQGQTGHLIASPFHLDLQTRHLPPEDSPAGKAYDEFQTTNCPYPGFATWDELTSSTKDMLFATIQKFPDSRILNVGVLTRGASITKHYKTMCQNLLALILFSAATNSWSSPISMLTNLTQMKNGELINSVLSKSQQMDAFYNFVNPLLGLAIVYMNPRNYMNYGKTLGVNIYRSITDVESKAMKWGVWVSARVVDRIEASDITRDDCNVCRGVEYGFYCAFQTFGIRQMRHNNIFALNKGYMTEEDEAVAGGDITSNGVRVSCQVLQRLP
jgi:hypothetical protein